MMMTPSDIEKVDLDIVHVLSGPIRVEGAEPGDILVVDLLDIGAFTRVMNGVLQEFLPKIMAVAS